MIISKKLAFSWSKPEIILARPSLLNEKLYNFWLLWGKLTVGVNYKKKNSKKKLYSSVFSLKSNITLLLWNFLMLWILFFTSFKGLSLKHIIFFLLFFFEDESLKVKVLISWFSWTAEIATLEWFLDFKIAFRVGWYILSGNRSAFCDSSKFRLVTIPKMKSFKVFATFFPSDFHSSSSIRIFFFTFIM